MPHDAEFTVEELIERLRGGDELERLHAALALGSLGEEARPAVPVLAGMLGSDSVVDRRAAAWALRELGDVAEEAVPALEEALEDEDDQVEDLAAQALLIIEGAEEDDVEDDGTEPFRRAA